MVFPSGSADISILHKTVGNKRSFFPLMFRGVKTLTHDLRIALEGASAAVYCAYNPGGLHEYCRRASRTFGYAHHHITVPYSDELFFGSAGNECAGAVVAVRCHRKFGTVLGGGEYTGARLGNLAGTDRSVCRQTYNPSRCAPERTSRSRDVLLLGAGSGYHH